MKVNFKNTEIFYETSGRSNGPVIVWLHGFMENSAIWQLQTEDLDSSYHNIVIDLLGHGDTGCIDDIHTMEQQAEAVNTVLESLNIEKFSLVGHSMGGYVGLALLKLIPEKITHFTLLNSTSYADSEEKKKTRDRAIKLVMENKTNFLRMSVTNLFSEYSREKYKSGIESLIGLIEDVSKEGIIAALKGMKLRSDHTNTLKEFNGKKLIISGISDPVLPFKDSEKEAETTNSEFITLEGGHMSYLEASEDVKDYIQLFLKNKL